jgi:hypothetical protein
MNEDIFIRAMAGKQADKQASSAPAGQDNPADRRRSPRHAYPTIATLIPLGMETSHALQVRVINVSLHGVGLRTPVAFDCNAEYCFRIGGDTLNLESRIRVVSSRKRTDGQYDTGAEYI